MINTIQAHVIGASRYKMDNGVQGAKISIMQAASAENENAIGNQVSVMTAPYEIFDQLHAAAPHMPCAMELDIDLRGGRWQNRASRHRRPQTQRHR